MTNVRESYELYVFRPLQPINSVTEFNIAHQRDYEITREWAVYAELNETNAFELRFIWILPKMGTVLTAHALQCCGASHIASDFQCVFCFYLITLGHIVVSRRPFSSAPDLFIHVFHSPEIHSCAESLQKKNNGRKYEIFISWIFAWPLNSIIYAHVSCRQKWAERLGGPPHHTVLKATRKRSVPPGRCEVKSTDYTELNGNWCVR